MFEHFGFEIVEEHAAGAGARSFLARVKGGDALALVTLGQIPTRGNAGGRLARAITRLATLNLQTLVEPLTAGCLPDGRPFVVSRFHEGETLAAALSRRGPLSPDELVLLAIPLCGALSALRGQGLLVRALHPEQVLLLGGFGQLTPALLAAPLFADEVEEDQAREARTDVAALGRLLKQALEDGRPDGPEGLKATLSVNVCDQPLREVIARCLTRDPKQAFRDPSEVARALAEHQPSTFIRGSLPRAARRSSEEPRPASETALPREGDVLGSYVLESVLGEGAMGRVYLARHATLGRQAALKVLRPEHASPALVRRFFQEAQAVNRIAHEHIVEIHDFAQEPLPGGGTRAYCVLELLGGQSLTEVLAHGPLPVTRAVRIARQVAQALEAAHREGVVHRDLKPDNLQLTERGGTADFVKVLDFGVAKLDALGEANASSTAEGTIVGTPTYMAPEQAAGLSTDPRTDIYALGTVLYEMLAGHPPFSGANFGQLAAQVISRAPPPLPRFTRAGEPIPSPLRALVGRCLEKDPDRRPGSMAELERQLTPFLTPARPGPRLRLRPLVPLAAALALLAGTAVQRLEETRTVATRAPVRVVAAVRRADAHPGSISTRVVTLHSRPAGARVIRLDTGEPLGVTPLPLLLARGEELRVRFSLPGHRPQVRTVSAVGQPSVEVGLGRKRPTRKRPTRPLATRRAPVDPFAL